MTTTLMMQNPGMWLGVVPLGILSLYHVSAALSTELGQNQLWRRFGLGAHQWLAANKVRCLDAAALLWACSAAA